MSRFLSSAPLSCLRREDLRKVENWRSRICKNSVSRKTALIMLRLPDENFDRESRSRRNIPVECVLHGLKILLLFQLQKPLQSPVCAPPPGVPFAGADAGTPPRNTRALFRQTCPRAEAPGSGKYMKSRPKTGRQLTFLPPKEKEYICIEKYNCFCDFFPFFCFAATSTPLYRNSAGTAAVEFPKPGVPATCIRASRHKQRPPRLRTPEPSQCT